MNGEKKIEEILKLGADLNTVQDVDILLEKVLSSARHYANADAGTIYIKHNDELIFSHAQNDTKLRELPDGKKLIYTSFSIPINESSIAGYVAVKGEPLSIPDVYNLPPEAPYKFDQTVDKRSNYRTRSALTVPMLNQNGKILGVLQVLNPIDDSGNQTSFSEKDELSVAHFANSASIVLQRAQLTRALLLRMIQMAELRDPKETGHHVNRVASYAVEIYERWAGLKGIPEKEKESNRDILRMAAMIHDAGKVGISDLILKKPGRLTEDEFEVMKAHTYIGARIFANKQSGFDEVAADVALSHHENWDGTGYPGYVDIATGEPVEKDSKGRALPRKGEEIPIFGRIVAIADVFDALSSKRVYKDSWQEKDVLDEIQKLSGSKFDPEVVDAFFDSLDLIRAIQHRYPDS